MDLIANNDEIVFYGELSQCQKLRPIEHPAGGIVWITNQQQLGSLVDQRSQPIEIELKPLATIAQWIVVQASLRLAYRHQERRINWGLNDDAIALIGECENGGEESLDEVRHCLDQLRVGVPAKVRSHALLKRRGD